MSIHDSQRHLTLTVKNMTTTETFTINPQDNVELIISEGDKFLQSIVTCPDALDESIKEAYKNSAIS